MEHDEEFLLESRLLSLSPDLHTRFSNMVFAMQNTLFYFHKRFPEFTDHSILHSMSVLDSCNQLIGPDQVNMLNEDEIYVLMMACYLHDVGMGISMDQYNEFSKELPMEDYLKKNPDASVADTIRNFHHEFSGCFVRKYEALLDIPSPEYTFAISQVCRGHRRTDLFDRAEFPDDWALPDGNRINLPYLSAILRLADEIDVSEARNPALLYQMDSFSNPHEICFHKRHEAVSKVVVAEDSILVYVLPCEPDIRIMLDEMIRKMQETLDYCIDAVHAGSSFEIRQRYVIVVNDTGSAAS